MDQRIMRYAAAAKSSGEIPWDEEGILLYDGGRIDTLLPGRAHNMRRAEPYTALMFRRDATFCGVAGAGDPGPSGGALRGWAKFSCRLLSARRFVANHRGEIREQCGAEEILTRMMREILADGFRAACRGRTESEAALCAAARRECHERAKDALLRSGWLLTSFRLEHLETSGGRDTCGKIR